MSRNSKLLSVFVAACAFALMFALVGCGGQASSSAAASSSASSAASASASSEISANEIAFTLKVDASDADKGMLYDSVVTAEKGKTVYDALVDTGLDLTVTSSSGSPYVDGIAGVVASTTGPTAGWLFTVNGEVPSVGAESVEIADGDEVVWTFFTNYNAK